MEEESLKSKADLESKGDLAFADMTLVQKIKSIEGVIDERIRPMLMMDGGNMEIIELKNARDGYTDVYIRYLGACSGCASGSTGTLFAIESVLQENLDSSIRVFPV